MNDPYVPTNRGWRRKIGPASKYRFNMPQEEAPSRFSRGDLRGSGRETNFQVSLREARELSEANAAIEAKDKQRTAQAKAAETERKQLGANRQAPPFAAATGRRPTVASGIGDMLKKARESGKRPGRTPYRGGMK